MCSESQKVIDGITLQVYWIWG